MKTDFVQFSSVFPATHTNTCVTEIAYFEKCFFLLQFRKSFFHLELSYFIRSSLQRHIELSGVDGYLLASGTWTARAPPCHADETEEEDAKGAADLLEDVDELFPEVFVEIGVEEGVEAG